MRTFRLQVCSLLGMIFDEEVESVFLAGDEGEFELLPFHYPLIAALPEGEIKVAKKGSIPIREGVVLFENNKCTIIVEAAKKEGGK